MEHLAPGRGAQVADAVHGLPSRTVYQDPKGYSPSPDERELLSAEFSLRSDGAAVSGARLAYTLAANL